MNFFPHTFFAQLMVRTEVFVIGMSMIVASLLLQACDTSWAHPDATETTTDMVTLRFIDDQESSDYGTVQVVGLSNALLSRLAMEVPTQASWPSLFAVYTASAQSVPMHIQQTKPAILGSYHINSRGIVFRSRYPFVPGLQYHAQVDLTTLGKRTQQSNLTGMLHLPFRIPVPDTTATTIERIYPSSNMLPENLLRFYIHFSAPMSRGHAFEHITLIGPNNKVIENPFLRIGQEFWDPPMQRLTVLLDPGRIKRDAAPNLQAGVPLQAGGTFRLVIDPAWRDANGNPLAIGFEKQFHVVAADRSSPNPADWQLNIPAPGTRIPLVIQFPESLDHALLGHTLQIHTDRAQLVRGGVEIRKNETEWWFIPEVPWDSGRYILIINPVLEDVAGNNLRMLFEVDLQHSSEHTLTTDGAQRIFVIQP